MTLASSNQPVIIVGGGVIGAACAHYLAASGRQVTIIDQGEFGAACSLRNCGYVCPSHVLPLTEPGAIGMAMKSVFRKDSPFRVKARLDFSLVTWLLQFARRCNRRDMMAAGRAMQPLLQSSHELYRELFSSGTLDADWQERGLLFVFGKADAMERYSPVDKLLSESFNEPARRIDGNALCELEPALRPGLAGGWHYEDDGHLSPEKLMNSWRAHLEAAGVRILERCKLTGLVRDGSRIRAVETLSPSGATQIETEAVVIATGSWTPLLGKLLGCRVPIEPGKGYSVTMPRPERCSEIPLLFPETRVGVTPFADSWRLGSTMEFAGFDDSIDEDRLALLRRGAEPFLRDPIGNEVTEKWFGWRPMTWDGLPVIDRLPGASNALLATGHNMLGLSMAPATGKLVSEILNQEEPHLDPAPYNVSRFL